MALPRSAVALDFQFRSNRTPPRHARLTGELLTWENEPTPVFIERRPVWKTRPRKDAEGQVLYHRTPTGAPIRPAMESYIDHYEEREFILVDGLNGMVRRHFGFRPTEAERVAQGVRADERAALADLAALRSVLAGRGLSLGDLARALGEGFEGPQGEDIDEQGDVRDPGDPDPNDRELAGAAMDTPEDQVAARMAALRAQRGGNARRQRASLDEDE